MISVGQQQEYPNGWDSRDTYAVATGPISFDRVTSGIGPFRWILWRRQMSAFGVIAEVATAGLKRRE